MHLIDAHELLKFFAALLFVLGLMGGLALALRKLNNLHPASSPFGRRLKIVEILPLDARRRLMLIRRDGREHLVILGANGETVVESGIEAGQDEAENENK